MRLSPTELAIAIHALYKVKECIEAGNSPLKLDEVVHLILRMEEEYFNS